MAPHIVFGAGGIGTTATSFTFTWDTAEKTSELLDALKRLDVFELDTGQSYPPGNPWCTNTLLGESKAAEKGFAIHDKLAVHRPDPFLDEKSMETNLHRSLELLGVESVPVLYAHIPDKNTPLEVTAAAFDKQFKAGKFKQLGLCNYEANVLAKYFDICDEKGYIKPTIYQGQYNPLDRRPEKALFHLLRKHNCKFYAYSPLAGGFLTGKATFGSDEELYRTRWRGESIHRGYIVFNDNEVMHEAVRKLKEACDAAVPPISMQEVSLRWIMNHSALQTGDAIIMGAKRIDQLEKNVADARKGPLEPALVEAVDSLWGMVQSAFS